MIHFSTQDYQAFVAEGMQDGVDRFDRSDDPRDLLFYAIGEIGEVFNAMKHYDDAQVKEELGDVLWYIFAAIQKVGLNADDVISTNVTKLTERYGTKA